MKKEKTYKVKMNAMAHSRTAAALSALRKLQMAKAIARAISIRMKDSLIQKEARRIMCWRKSFRTISLDCNWDWEGRG